MAYYLLFVFLNGIGTQRKVTLGEHRSMSQSIVQAMCDHSQSGCRDPPDPKGASNKEATVPQDELAELCALLQQSLRQTHSQWRVVGRLWKPQSCRQVRRIMPDMTAPNETSIQLDLCHSSKNELEGGGDGCDARRLCVTAVIATATLCCTTSPIYELDSDEDIWAPIDCMAVAPTKRRSRPRRG